MYVGDATRDIQAGKAAGMITVAAAYGYVEPGAQSVDVAGEYPDEIRQNTGYRRSVTNRLCRIKIILCQTNY